MCVFGGDAWVCLVRSAFHLFLVTFHLSLITYPSSLFPCHLALIPRQFLLACPYHLSLITYSLAYSRIPRHFLLAPITYPRR